MIELNIVNLTKQKIPKASLLAVSNYSAKFLNLKGELSLVIAGDRKLRSLNKGYRGIDKTTDVLSFSLPSFLIDLLGEIFININDCSRSSKYLEVLGFKASREYILFFLLIHGLLHLAGYNDEREKERLEMIGIGKDIMDKLIKNKLIKIKS